MDFQAEENMWRNFDVNCPDWQLKKNILFHPSVKLNKKLVVLDLGCAVGRLCKMIHKDIAKYIGVDVSEKLVNHAKLTCKGIKNAEFHVNDGQTMPMIKSDSVDIVAANTLFQHISLKTSESYIREVHRVLKRGGLFIGNLPRITYYGYGYTDELVADHFKKFKWKLLTCEEDEKTDRPYKINLQAYYYIHAVSYPHK